MESSARAMQIAGAIELARDRPLGEQGCTVTVRVGCAACDPGACALCGYLFTGEIFALQHETLGRLILSDKTVHYLGHGITHYETGYYVRGEVVVVNINLEELAEYLNLHP